MVLNTKIKSAILIFSMFLSACKIQSNSKISVNEDEVVLVGYGSLLSIESLEKTLGHPYDKEYVSAKLTGYKRVWNVFTPNHPEKGFHFFQDSLKVKPGKIIYLNVEEDTSVSPMNVCLFKVSKAELKAFDQREWVYKRVDVREKLTENPYEESQPIWMYVALDEYKLDSVSSKEEAIIRESYLDIVEDGLKDWGEEFREDFWKSSEKPDSSLIAKDFLE